MEPTKDMTTITVTVNSTGIDDAIQKAKKLESLLYECKRLIAEISDAGRGLKAEVIIGR